MIGHTKKNQYLFRNSISIFILLFFIVFETFYLTKNYNEGEKLIYSDIAEIIGPKYVVNEVTSNDEFFESKNDPYFTEVTEDYFKNTLFIGDSRTVGFRIHKILDGATYYANQSFGVYGGFDRTMQLKGYGLITLGELLDRHKFDKIYISLGINNVATDPQNHERKYREFLDHILETQPKAIVFLLANLHVTKFQNTDLRVNNTRINIINNFVKGFADGKRVFYIDPNEVYDDELGCLDENISNDGYHIEARYYDKYLDFLLKHGIVKD